MPVRGTTAWKHAINQKKVIDLDHGSGRHIMCAWDSCERDGYEYIKVRVKTHADDITDERDVRYMNYVFCSERHKGYWLNNMRPNNHNNLPPGMRLSIL